MLSIAILGVILSNFTFAQVSGYMGHRIVVTGGLAWGGPIAKIGNDYATWKSKMAAQALLNASYIVGRRSSVGIGLSFAGLQDSVVKVSIASAGEPYNRYSSLYNIYYNEHFYTVKSRVFSAVAEYRAVFNGKKGSLAPCGLYGMTGLGLNFYSWGKRDAALDNYLKKPLMLPVIRLALGSQKVYADRAVVDFGLETNLPVGVRWLPVPDYQAQLGEAYSQFVNSATSSQRLWLATVLSPYLRIGLLP